MATGMKIAPIESAAFLAACFDEVAEEVGAVDLPGTFGLRVRSEERRVGKECPV